MNLEAPRGRQRRLTPELKLTPVDRRHPLVLDEATAKALRTYGSRRGWRTIQQTQDNRDVLFWRVK